ncbi:NAD-binding protein [Candidatus Woesearchaeota archaeon]|nr:NAD-binding protein [Candidatus Woesearchaeota archaeon]
MKMIIVGGGETALTLTKLFEKEADITIIEKDEIIAKELTQKTNALIIHGDGTDISILKEAEIEKADALIVTTSDDTTNLMISQIGKSEKVRKVIPLVRKPKNAELFSKLGVNTFVSVAGSNASEIKNILRTYGDAKVIAQFGEGDVQIIQQVIAKKSKLIRQKVEIKNAVIATIYRSGKIIIPTPETILKEGDVLLVAVKTKDLHGVLDIIKGE